MKISDVISYIVLCLLIVVTVLIYLPKILGLSCFYVTSDSMEPTLKEGYLVLTEKVEFDEIETGDIITFRNETSTKWCTHRVVMIERESQSFKTKGDNNTLPDPLRTDYELVVGKVVMAIPTLGGVTKALDSTVARVVIVLLCVIYVAIEIEIYRNRKKKGMIRE